LSSPLTFPHDYRVIADSEIRPTIVGGQAVNLWAITFLEEGDFATISTKYGSGDLDVLAGPKVVEFLKSLGPNWRVDKIPFKIFGHGLEAVAHGIAPDGRKLLVEVLKNVKGLDARDLEETVELALGGAIYKVLDPIALLKAKAANVRDLDQVGPPPRQDINHLQLVARCLPIYLRQIHAQAQENPAAQKKVAATFSRAFAALTDRRTREGLIKAEIDLVPLIPLELATSAIAPVANTYRHQLPRVRGEKPPVE
jgi:hypothetical protein